MPIDYILKMTNLLEEALIENEKLIKLYLLKKDFTKLSEYAIIKHQIQDILKNLK